MRKFRTVVLFLVFYLSFYLTRSHNDKFDEVVIVDKSEQAHRGKEDSMKNTGGAGTEAATGAGTAEGTEVEAQQLIQSWAGDNENLFYFKIGIFVCLLIVVILNGVVGRKTNRMIALYWLRSCKDIFLQNFAKIGNEKSFLLEKSYDKFEFYCTGRKNCNYYFANLNLCKRQCLWRYFIFNHFVKERDTMSVAIHFEKLDKGVLCIFKKHQKKYIDCRFPSLNKYTKLMTKKELKACYDIKGDSNEIMDLVLSGKILNFLNTYDRYINYVCITDIALFDSEDRQSGEKEQKEEKGEKQSNDQKEQRTNKGGKHKFCFLNFVIPKDVEDLRTLVNFSIYMIDACYCIELSEKVREHVRKLRSIVEKEDLKRKQQLKELQERRKAQKLQEEKEKVEKMSAEQQRKYEEKKQKKSLKKMKKIKIIKM
ncbi:conserved protein, unknown function [Plasmodium knowlesi strain H]|uniref:Uncharacterized protein n=3 Tax=Plasmodium knowlesi TaxID=5850 RepID=A0A5K1UJY8_PLAKH|nr:conserved protein, unknown function [Plasmodium knowlesi strain H]OTN65732.1 Uncharacterized protein PKNOH_S100051100 [Plasmodium knowlesi]CAA9987869.1 conserved protein, unknown function [Plasmodium knowlesi strain H]SBO22293.1 conserved protein, unknown function [Plasmodium knowlesi strain H]SBO28802.1 conserved protein, unknown function [Plasmodium knowlesi strain H]VVS77343.1 conserved protein, unknown function [Plasmodium knowlesi strain H]|eukprot:XP_002258868.1 hypothetical protein, conserved in Plasmodium species [Plasmodium knowlesi strain H]